jgi:hypothetical protein
MLRKVLLTLGLLLGFASPALATESANGTTVPVALSITDADGAVWTLRLSDRTVLKNGVATAAVNVLEIWYINHTVWTFTGIQWSRWLDHYWMFDADNPTGRLELPTTAGRRSNVPLGPQTGVSCSGVNISAGSDIQAAVDANETGTTFCLAIGAYNQQTVTPKTGDIFIGAFDGTNGAVMDGQSVTQHAFGGTANYVVIQNMFIKNYAAPTQHGQVEITGTYLLLQQNDISFATQGSAIYVNDYATVIGNHFEQNAQQAYGVHGDLLNKIIVGVLFDSNFLDTNNPTQVLWDPNEQGGGKALNTQYLTFWYNEALNNGGPAFWTDWDNIYVTYWYNYIHGGLHWNGIEHEISYNASIIGNHIIEVANDSSLAAGCTGSYFGCGSLQIENSGGATGAHVGLIEIAYNTIVPGANARSISMREQSRGQGDKYSIGEEFLLRNIWVHHNTIDMSGGRNDGQIGAINDIGDSQLYISHNIKFDHNAYTLGSVGWFVWLGDYFNSYTAWKALGFDTHSTP